MSETDIPPTDPAAVPPSPSKVHIVIAGHEILVEAVGDLETIAATALDLFARTAKAAERIPTGYGIPAPDITLAPDISEEYEP